MIAFIEGIVADKRPNELVILAGGVGFLLQCGVHTVSSAPAMGEVMRVYTYLSVREDAMELFGFQSTQERAMFERLISVSGIGPKTALGILSSMPLKDLTLAIVFGDAAALSRAPGVGKKTAQRIALELKEKVSETDFGTSDAVSRAAGRMAADAVTDAVLALQSLGYSAMEARAAINAVRDKASETDELIKLALRAMAGGVS
ncbi:MAG: Holliday junction branch migration protein RuvA [Clostridia bacterium]|jgi:Holliday junction DNA helicase RuvA|nr:Holliday junction branch migration protein RuvA [Clostridia bacterium]